MFSKKWILKLKVLHASTANLSYLKKKLYSKAGKKKAKIFECDKLIFCFYINNKQ